MGILLHGGYLGVIDSDFIGGVHQQEREREGEREGERERD